MKITQTNTKYVIETSDGKIHILNRKSLIWTLKNTFNLKGEQGKSVMTKLDTDGTVEVAA